MENKGKRKIKHLVLIGISRRGEKSFKTLLRADQKSSLFSAEQSANVCESGKSKSSDFDAIDAQTSL